MTDKEARLIKDGTRLLCIDSFKDGSVTHLTQGKEYTIESLDGDVFEISDCDTKCGQCLWNIKRFAIPITAEEIKVAKLFDPDLLFGDVSNLNFKVNSDS